MMTFVYSVSDLEEHGGNCGVDSMDNVESDWECYPSGLESNSFYSEF